MKKTVSKVDTKYLFQELCTLRNNLASIEQEVAISNKIISKWVIKDLKRQNIVDGVMLGIKWILTLAIVATVSIGIGAGLSWLING